LVKYEGSTGRYREPSRRLTEGSRAREQNLRS
jgi:hypothetical protein